MDKNPRDIIIKASYSLQESAKEMASTNLVTAMRSGEIKLDQAQLQKLILIVGASIEEGHSRAVRAFSRSVDEALTAAALPPAKKK